jgi:hypothetical protein
MQWLVYLNKKVSKKIRIRIKKCLNLNIIKKIRDMAIGKRNSGKFAQDGVISKFHKDAKVGGNTSTVAQALEQGKKNAEYKATVKEPVRISFYVPKR